MCRESACRRICNLQCMHSCPDLSWILECFIQVGAQLTQVRRNEELARALEQDKRELFAYVIKLSEERLRMVKEVQSRLPVSPIHDVFPITPVNGTPWRISARDIQPVDDTAPCAKGTMGQAKRGRLGGGVSQTSQPKPFF